MRKLLTNLLIALMSVAALPLLAQTPEEVRELREQLERLEEQLETLRADADDDRIEELARRIEILTREIEDLRIREDAPAEADRFEAGLGEAASKIYRSGTGVAIGGYGEMVYENFDSSRDDGGASGKSDQIDFLRGVIYLGYKFSERVLFNSEIEFEHGTTSGGVGSASVEFAYLDFMLHPLANVRAGMLLVPVGLVNELHEPTAFLSVERPLTENALIPTTWRENGAGIYGETGNFAYRAYVVNGLKGEKFSASGLRGGRQKGGKALAEDFALATRLDWSPAEGVLVGGSLYTGNSGQNLGIDLGTTILELHADARLRGWWLRGRWSRASLDDVAALNEERGYVGSSSVGEELSGWYGEVGYDLASIFAMGEASVTPFIRWEEVNTQEEVPAGFMSNPANDVEILTLGVAWKPIPQAVIKADYQDYENGAGTGVDQFNLGLGYIF